MKTELSYQQLIAHRRAWERAGRANTVLSFIIKIRHPVVHYGHRAAWLLLATFALCQYFAGSLLSWPWLMFVGSMLCFASTVAIILANEIAYRVRAHHQKIWSLARNVIIDQWETYEYQFPDHAERLAMLSQEVRLRSVASVSTSLKREKV